MAERSERPEPPINKILFVSERDLQLIKPWPLELRALFDPQADRDLACRINQERAGPEQVEEKEIPF